MANAKELARKYVAFEGQVTFWMLPWNTIMFSVVTEKLEKMLGKKAAAFDPVERFFPAAESITVDIEFNGELSPEVQGLRLYWQSRNGNTADNFENYLTFLSDAVWLQWFSAYGETRDHSLSGGDALEKPAADADAKKKRSIKKP